MLESYRYLIDENYGTDEGMILAIKGLKEWSTKMTFGTAFQAVIEHGPEKFLDRGTGLYHIRDSNMPEEVVLKHSDLELAIKFREQYPNIVHEIPDKFYLDCGEFIALISFKVDGADGLILHENKTTDKAASHDKYLKSMQWRAYLLATQAVKVQYNVFSYHIEEGTNNYIVDLSTFTFYPYNHLETDVRMFCNSFYRYCKRNGVLGYLKQNVEKVN